MFARGLQILRVQRVAADIGNISRRTDFEEYQQTHVGVSQSALSHSTEAGVTHRLLKVE